MRLTSLHITQWRLRHQHLTTRPLADPVAVVRHQGAVQAQDYGGAKWALAMRLPPTTDAALDAAFDRGEILRTHVLRPTWHFVTPADIRWMLALTGPRVHAASASRFRELGLDGKTLDRAMTALQRAMEGGRHLVREELRAALDRARVPAPDSQRFAYVMMHAELEALVCSGPRRGKQFTHALLDERAPLPAAPPPLAREDAVRELARRYFAARGPATLHDFAVWSGLTTADGRLGVEANGDLFTSAAHDGQTWWFPAGDTPRPRPDGRAHLLPNYDEYFIGFKHRGPLLERFNAHAAQPTSRDLLAHILVIDGQVAGGWRRTLGTKGVAIGLAPVVPLTRAERGAVEEEAERYGRFMERTPTVSWTG